PLRQCLYATLIIRPQLCYPNLTAHYTRNCVRCRLLLLPIVNARPVFTRADKNGVMRRTLECLQNASVQIVSDENLVELEYADDILVIFKEKVQVFSGEVSIVIPSSGGVPQTVVDHIIETCHSGLRVLSQFAEDVQSVGHNLDGIFKERSDVGTIEYLDVHASNTGEGERQLLNDKNKTDPGNLGKSLAPAYQFANP
ncbi:hypothetical protein CLF_113031, partial [Clonorchis sinensis]